MTQWDKDMNVPYTAGTYPNIIHYQLCSSAPCESEVRDVESMYRMNPLGKPDKMFTNPSSWYIEACVSHGWFTWFTKL